MSSSSSNKEKNGSANDWVVKDFSNSNNKEGSKSKLVLIATAKVMETKMPKNRVPSNVDMENIRNPKNNTMDVYIMLTPVSFSAKTTASRMFQLFMLSSWRYLAKK